ncbi:MAG: hypothetical protein ABGY41_19055 [Candidatus Poribacteria bacterium]
MNGHLRLLAWPLVAFALLLVACGEDVLETVETPTAPTSQIAFVSDRDGYRRIYVMDPDGANQRPLTDPRYGDDSSPAWSPDGSQIAFSSDRSGESEIFVMDADGGNQRNITRSRLGSDTQPAWSPDGTQIVYVFGPYSGYEHIRVMDADGENERKLRVPGPGRLHRPCWTADGERIVFGSLEYAHDGGAAEVYAMDADGQNLSVLVGWPGKYESPAASPDGSRVATVSYESAYDYRITVFDMDGSNSTVVTEGAPAGYRGLAWSPDGRCIAYAAIDRSPENVHTRSVSAGADIYVVDLDDLGVRRLTNSRDFDGVPAWSP